MQIPTRVRTIRRHLSDIEFRISTLEREVVDLVDDLWYVDDVIKITNACRQCVRELRRQLADIESH